MKNRQGRNIEQHNSQQYIDLEEQQLTFRSGQRISQCEVIMHSRIMTRRCRKLPDAAENDQTLQKMTWHSRKNAAHSRNGITAFRSPGYSGKVVLYHW